MATLTVDQDLEAAPRTAGEAFTLNGGVLRIRTDTRWHENAPAANKGAIGSCAVSTTLGGGVLIDATAVRWMAFDTGSGVVPAIGATITQGGVTGDLLGVWTAVDAVPTAVGAAMPTTGFLKFRSVTSGPFVAGALTGIGANASSPDVVGWIEILGVQSATMTIPRLGFFRTRGDYFELGTTTGAPGQVVQTPMVGGGSLTTAIGLSIETAPGSGVYEDFPALGVAADFSYTNLAAPRGETDRRQAYCKSINDGRLQIGEDVDIVATYTWAANVVTVTSTAHGFAVNNLVRLNFTTGGATASTGTFRILTVATNTFTVALTGSGTAGDVTIEMTVGYVPVAGCKIRIPNIIMRQVVSGATADVTAAVHTSASSRPEFATTSAGQIDIENTTSDWYYNLSQPYSVAIRRSFVNQIVTLSECATAFVIEDTSCGNITGGATTSLTLSTNYAGGIVRRGKWNRCGAPSSNSHAISIVLSSGVTVEDVTAHIIRYARSTGYTFNVTTSTDVFFTRCRAVNGLTGLSVTYTDHVEVTDFDYCNRAQGQVNNAGSALTMNVLATNVTIDGVTWGYGFAIEGQHPNRSIVSFSGARGAKLRNVGTRASPAPCLTPSNFPLLDLLTLSSTADVDVRRVYVDGAQSTNNVGGSNADQRLTIANVMGGMSFTALLSALQGTYKGLGAAPSVVTQASIYGSHWSDHFISDIAGVLLLAAHEPLPATAAQAVIVSGSPQFTSANSISMPVVGDQVVWEMPYFALGHTGFKSTNPTLSGTLTGNLTMEYQVDLGAGYSGSWQSLTGANLNAEGAIDPEVGFRLKIRATTATAATTNALQFVRVYTDSSAVAQGLGLYPLDEYDATLELTGVETGTEIHVYRTSDAVEIGGTESLVGSTFTMPYRWNSDDGDVPVFITLIKPGLQWLRLNGQLLPFDGLSIPVFQSVDRAYSNP